MNSNRSWAGRLRVLLVLGRVSNLPTVWSNCLAAWLLGGGGLWQRFGLLCAGATLLYTGGMFLNDACDIEFDRRYRPERPIIAGQVSARAVWILAATWLTLGWLAIMPLGPAAATSGSALLASIVCYDIAHKRFPLAPVLMAACRFLLYLVAASAAHDHATEVTVWRALALAAYIIGLSCLARSESTSTTAARWPIALLFVPIAVGLITSPASGVMLWAVAAGQAAWVLWCLWGGTARRVFFNCGVAGLLAGIVLVDWLAAAGGSVATGAVFAGLFLLALLFQRVAPAT